ncbi:Plasmodium exported protein (PHIST), unknown function [Plasmodium malariae]|uniref:Plasmodium RESA N-terminal domain-containing protein n=1 Tax=Plasmodium malariae TaxID=5858 RepID=A0A1A8WW51_PLAMA|nr:Plasmodium exported protein (PHIST), unknown function [Plasmodium malariae]
MEMFKNVERNRRTEDNNKYGANFQSQNDLDIQFNNRFSRNLLQLEEENVTKNENQGAQVLDGEKLLTKENEENIYEDVNNNNTPSVEQEKVENTHNDNLNNMDLGDRSQELDNGSNVDDDENDNNTDLSEGATGETEKTRTLEDNENEDEENLKMDSSSEKNAEQRNTALSDLSKHISRNAVAFIKKRGFASYGMDRNVQNTKSETCNSGEDNKDDVLNRDNTDISRSKKDLSKYILKTAPLENNTDINVLHVLMDSANDPLNNELMCPKISNVKDVNEDGEITGKIKKNKKKGAAVPPNVAGDDDFFSESCNMTEKKKKKKRKRKKTCKMLRRVKRYEKDLEKYFPKIIRYIPEYSTDNAYKMHKLIFGDIEHNSNVGAYSTSTYCYEITDFDERLRDSTIKKMIDNLDHVPDKQDMFSIWWQVVRNEKYKYINVQNHLRQIFHDMKNEGEIANCVLNERWLECQELAEKKFGLLFTEIQNMCYEMIKNDNITLPVFKEYINSLRTLIADISENVQAEGTNILKAPFVSKKDIPQVSKGAKYWLKCFFN